jgi:HTH-type transcriptional regulator/antitoxin HigA
MNFKLIKSEQDYESAISLLEKIGDNPDFEKDENLINGFEVLEKLIEIYERENFPIENGNPIEIIKLKMAYMDLAQKDLIPFIGSKGVVSEVMNKKRRLSKSMIRNLSEYLNISQEILNTEYQLNLDQKTTFLAEKRVSKKGALKFLTPAGIDTSFITNRVKSRGVTFAICS